MDQLAPLFKITPIDKPEYIERLDKEIKLLTDLGFLDYIIRINKIYTEHIAQYPNLLRGSSGSFLILYYLGISQIDPIKYSIPLSRFINIKRTSNPDIDIDVSTSIRDKIMEQIINMNSDCIRMSCDIHSINNEYFADLIKEDPTLNTTHSSGIIIYDQNQIEIIEKFKILPKQISLNRTNIGDFKLKKMDVLVNSGLEQLIQINNKNIFEYDFEDPKVFEFIWNDDGIGISFAETPQIQNVFKILKPSNIQQLSTCLAIIRPFACSNIDKNITWDKLEHKIIYDDDFIIWLRDKLGYSEDDADDIRRMLKKNNNVEKRTEFINIIESSNLELSHKYELKKAVFNLHRYSFCKSHSLNYAHLVYCLYWNKYYNTKLFWKHTIKTIKGFYREWVYIRKGLGCGLKFKGLKNCSPFYHLAFTGYWINKEFISRCYLRKISNNNDNNDNNINNDKPLSGIIEDYTDINNQPTILDTEIDMELNPEYPEHTNNINDFEPIIQDEIKYEIKYDNEYEFRGIIATQGNISNKNKKYQMVITIGYDNDKFINLYLNKKRDLSRFKQVMGKGYLISNNNLNLPPYIIIKKMTLL